MRTVALFLLAAGCGATNDEDGPVSCDPADRTGAYVIHYTERPNGSCGPMPDEVARIDGGGGIADGCTLDAPDTWSADQCRLDRSVTCCEPPVCLSVVASTEQVDASGATISGVTTVTILNDLSQDGCISTYDLTATRQ